MIGAMRKLTLPGLLGLSLFITGCLEEKDTVTVYPNGSGTIHLHKKFSEQLSEMMTSFGGDNNNLQATLDNNLYKDLSQWDGVTAWTGCKAVLDGKCIVTEATGYFDNISKLRFLEEKNTQSFSWTKNNDGRFTLTWSSDNKNDQNPFDQPPLPPDQIKQVEEMIKGLKIERQVILPGIVTTSTGSSNHQDRSASFVITDDDLIKYFALLDDYRKKIDKGDLTKEQAYTELKGKFPRLSMNMRVTCRPRNVDDEFAQFQQDYKKAKADYASLDTAKKIRDAKKRSPNAKPPPAPDKSRGETK